MEFVKKVWRIIYKIFNIIRGKYWEKKRNFQRKKKFDNRMKYVRTEIIDNYINDVDIEKREIAEYLQKNKLEVFNYSFVKRYRKEKNIDCYYDDEYKMFYILHCGKKLYFPRKYTKKSAIKLYLQLTMEQDVKSPHRYFQQEANFFCGKIMLDIGAAEGMISLEIVEKLSKLYLFECDSDWMEALERTFWPWRNKVIIVPKMVGEKSDFNKNEVSLDDYFSEIKEEKINIIKMDAEGSEKSILKGASKIINDAQDLFLAITVYHNNEDNSVIKQLLSEKNDFFFENSNGYMVFIYDNQLDKPWLRRGILRCWRNA